MTSRQLGRVVACWHGPTSPTDAEWNHFLQLLRTMDLRTARGFVVTLGGAPTGPQRDALAGFVRTQQVPIAVLSDKATVRFVVSLLAMLTKRIRCFELTQVAEACAHLDLTLDETRGVVEFVAEVTTRAQAG